MDDDLLCRSSDIRELLHEDVSNSDNSDIEAQDIPDDVNLQDFSSGSDDNYVPDSDEESSDNEDVVSTLPSTSSNRRPKPPKPTRPKPTRPKKKNLLWIRAYPPEQAIDITQSFRVRNPGPTNCPSKNSKAIEYFNLFFTNAIWQYIVRETNSYARRRIEEKQGNLSIHSRWKRWKYVTVKEIKKYFGIILNMGLTPRKNQQSYWDTRPKQIIPFYGQTMSYNQFVLIQSFLHLTSAPNIPRGQVGYDPWVKVRHIYDHLNATFKQHFVAGQNVCIDESLIGMKNRTSFIQYMPNKKHKQYGLKKFEACDSKTSYVIHIELYSSQYLKDVDGPFVEKVIMDVMAKSNLLDRGYHLFTDRYYTKVPLALHLLERNTYLSGTINKNSQYLAETAVKSNLGARESLYFRHKDVLLVAFKQKISRKPVFALTTACHAEDIVVRSKKGIEGVKPVLIHNYNQHMGGVDVSDKCAYHTSCSRPSSKYWKRILYNFVDIAVFNAYVLYKENSDRPKDRREFIVDIIDSLTEEDNPGIAVPGPGGDTGEHKLERLPLKRERKCVVCSHTKTRGRSRYWCPGCNSGVHQGCFHLLEHYWRPQTGGRKRKVSSSSSE